MCDEDEAFKAYEHSLRTRSVLDVEHERIAKGHRPDDALLKHGAEIENEILRTLAHAAKPPAVILDFPSRHKSGGT